MKFIPGPYVCEDLEEYQEGGFHPVVIGDQFQNQRYSVIHKLGSGGYATVWLVQDHQENRYAALKILTGYSSTYTHELKVYQHLQAKGGYEKCLVVPLLDSFWVDGPNGHHLCLVFEVMGPSIASFSRDYQKKIRPDVVRGLALQTAKGLVELHERSVAYGDLSAANILVRLIDINSWTVEEIYARLGRPEAFEVQKTVPSEDPVFTYEAAPSDYPCAPKTVYESIAFSQLDHDLFLPEVRFIDLGEAYMLEEPRNGFGVNWSYADPQTLWWTEVPDQTSDIWALACVWYEMRAAEQLFPIESGGVNGIQNDIIDAVGPLPPAWIERIQKDTEEDNEGEQFSGDDADREAADETKSTKAPSIWIKVISFWSRIRSRLSKKRTKTSEPEPSPIDPETEYHFTDADGDSLSQKIKKIGHWKRWCYLSVEERRAVVKAYQSYGKDPEEVEPVTDDEVNTGAPPPERLSDDEAADFENILSSMLKIERVDRTSLDKLMAHPWLTKAYEQSTSGPWLENFSRGREYQIHDGDQKFDLPGDYDWTIPF